MCGGCSEGLGAFSFFLSTPAACGLPRVQIVSSLSFPENFVWQLPFASVPTAIIGASTHSTPQDKIHLKHTGESGHSHFQFVGSAPPRYPMRALVKLSSLDHQLSTSTKGRTPLVGSKERVELVGSLQPSSRPPRKSAICWPPKLTNLSYPSLSVHLLRSSSVPRCLACL